jgi:Na+/H+ antiporter NhaC
MNIMHMIGWAIIVLLFGGIFIAIWKGVGIKEAFITYGFTAIICGIAALAAYCLKQ